MIQHFQVHRIRIRPVANSMGKRDKPESSVCSEQVDCITKSMGQDPRGSKISCPAYTSASHVKK